MLRLINVDEAKEVCHDCSMWISDMHSTYIGEIEHKIESVWGIKTRLATPGNYNLITLLITISVKTGRVARTNANRRLISP